MFSLKELQLLAKQKRGWTGKNIAREENWRFRFIFQFGEQDKIFAIEAIEANVSNHCFDPYRSLDPGKQKSCLADTKEFCLCSPPDSLEPFINLSVNS